MTVFDEKRQPWYRLYYSRQLSERVRITNRSYYYANEWWSIQQIRSSVYFFPFFTFLSELLVEQILFALFLVFKNLPYL